MINILIKAGAKVNAIEINQNTALHAAVATNTLEVIRALITCGSDVCAKNHSGLTPLMLAVMNNLDPAVISLLLSSGADINARGNSDERVFHLATENNSIDIIKIILEAGANINETDNNGITPFDGSCI